MVEIDGENALWFAMEKGLGLQRYRYIMEHVLDVDVSKNEDFKRMFNGFYGIRRGKSWRDRYYQVFEQMKKEREHITFKDIFNRISDQSLEASFSSKMLATLNSQKPIWDSRVLHFLKLQPTGVTKVERIESIIKIYTEIEAWYKNYLSTEDARNNLILFDRTFPEYSWISATKKIDFMIWSYDASADK